MKIASLTEIKRELNERTHKELIAFCLRIAKFKKDNKALLNYLLFEAFDEENFKEVLKCEIEVEFADMNTSSLYLAKKSIRRILRMVTKNIRYSDSKQTTVELLIFFCQKMRELDLPYHESKVLVNLYNRQLLNIQKALSFLDEDLQFDYQSELEGIYRPL